MARSKARVFTSNGKIFFGVIIVLSMVCYSSMNWFSYLFMPTKKIEDGQQHNANATSSSWTNHSHSHAATAYIYMGRKFSSPAGKLIGNSNTSAAASALHSRDNSTLTSTSNNVSNNSTYIQLPLPNASLPPISFTAYCGIGHRISRNLPAMVYAISHSRPLVASWGDVLWNVLFNNTANIKEGTIANENYGNNQPENWRGSPLAYTKPIAEDALGRATAYEHYGDKNKVLFEMPLAQSIVKSLSVNLSSLVLSFLEPMREQYSKSDLHLCVHIREGNNETGDWQRKPWRHVELVPILNLTLASMRTFSEKKSATNVSIFVASDSEKARPWFEENAPSDWHVVKPAKELPRPETGVWFGEHDSPTGANLTQDQKNEAMAEAVADAFALGECDALYIPNYSSFSIVGITLTRAERKPVFFFWTTWMYAEYPW